MSVPQEIVNPKVKFDEESHTYWLDERKDIKFDSATTFISKFFAPFNAPKIAKKLVSTHPKYKDYTVKELLKEWQQSGTHGTKVHDEVEKYILGELQKDELTEKKADLGVEYLDEYVNLDKYDLYPEVKVASVKYRISGMVDLLAHNPKTDTYVILDWKTNKKITTSAYKGKTGIRPETSNIEDCKYNVYSLQMSLYRFILEDEFDIDIKRQVLVHLKPSGRDVYYTPYMKSTIKQMLGTRINNN